MAHLYQRRHLKIRNQLRFSGFGLIMSTVLLLMCGCAKHEASTTPAPQSSPADQSMTTVAQKPAPTLTEVNAAVTRVFKNAATIDSKHEPNFFIGDFNGDNSLDLAVILKPENEKLAEMNQESPPWILKDPLSANRPAPPLQVAGARNPRRPRGSQTSCPLPRPAKCLRPEQLRALAEAAVTLAEAEGLDAHARSVAIRLNR